MRLISITEDQAAQEFARAAAEDMAANPASYIYTKGHPTAGRLLAVRWNDFTILVVKLDMEREPSLYPTWELIARDLPPLSTSAAHPLTK